MNADALTVSKIEDKIRQSLDGYYVTCTDFLDLHEQSLAASVCRKSKGVDTLFWGGYADAERRKLFISPKDYAESDADIVEMVGAIGAVRIRVVGSGHAVRELSHRDYLGSVLGLGLTRAVIGDILVRPGGADMLISSEIEQYLLSEYSKAGRTYLELESISTEELLMPERRLEVIRDTVPSLRLDNVISTAFRVSRSEATRAISSGLVFVDHTEASHADKRVDEGATLILRGKGKAVLKSIGNESKKGRIWIEINRFV